MFLTIFLDNKNLDDLYNSDPEDIDVMKARKKSKTHDYVEDGIAVFVSFDIETGGDNCGILQISAECFILNKDGNKCG